MTACMRSPMGPPWSACLVWCDTFTSARSGRADLHGDGTVDNVLYVDYLQEARLDLLRHHARRPTPNPGEGLVVVRTVVDYVRPLRLEDAPLCVGTWVCDLRAASFTLGYELTTGPASEPVCTPARRPR